MDNTINIKYQIKTGFVAWTFKEMQLFQMQNHKLDDISISYMLVLLRRIQTCEGVIRTALPDGTLQIEVNNVLPKVRQCWLNGPGQHYNLYVQWNVDGQWGSGTK